MFGVDDAAVASLAGPLLGKAPGGGQGGTRVSQSVSQATNIAFNPIIGISSGGEFKPQSGGDAYGSPASSATSAGNDYPFAGNSSPGLSPSRYDLSAYGPGGLKAQPAADQGNGTLYAVLGLGAAALLMFGE